ncbi:MAG TPA: exodeoxyribonuclease VII small subunit [Candidatus Methanoperedenaceae archaeon]|nr:exodeoxyribonuclease VII small subunit [Candidatus Methanoperedenaceae archaeon]
MEELTYEQALEELERIVAELEEGQLPLEDSLSKFERGIALVRLCDQKLKTAEMKVEKLIEEQGSLKTEPFGD